MAKKDNKKVNPIAANAGKTLDLTKFNLKTDKDQYAEIKTVLDSIYGDKLDVTKRHIMKVIGLTLAVKDDYIYLPYNLKVSKEKLTLKFDIVKKKPVGAGWIIFGLWLLIFALVGATYAGFRYVALAQINKDIDNDGIADINIDIDGDEIAEINVDTSDNNKPNINIDYKGNRKKVFNIDLDDDGNPDTNLVVNAVNDKDHTCKINCDTDGDGWPDLNLDLDGDGVPDTDIDTDKDGVADLNLDIDGDGICDIMCDDNNDNICDHSCIKTNEMPEKGTGSSTQTGDPGSIQGTTSLVINFKDGETVNIRNLYPDDQPDVEIVRPYKTFTIENLSPIPIRYSLKWRVITNTFNTNNFQYKVDSTNGGGNLKYTPAPLLDSYILKDILIPARTSQKYTFTFNLVGTGKPQNEDQGKFFQAEVDIEL